MSEDYTRMIKMIEDRIEWIKKQQRLTLGNDEDVILTLKRKSVPRGENVRLLGAHGPLSRQILGEDYSSDGKFIHVTALFDADKCIRYFEGLLSDLKKEQ